MDKLTDKINKMSKEGIAYTYVFDNWTMGFSIIVLTITIVAAIWISKKL